MYFQIRRIVRHYLYSVTIFTRIFLSFGRLPFWACRNYRRSNKRLSNSRLNKFKKHILNPNIYYLFLSNHKDIIVCPIGVTLGCFFTFSNNIVEIKLYTYR